MVIEEDNSLAERYTKNAEIAEGIAESVDKHGWNQGNLVQSDTGEYCLLGHGQVAQGREATLHPGRVKSMEYDDVLDYRTAVVLGFHSEDYVYFWNDEVGRTRDEVLSLCEERAKYWRNK